MNQSSGKTALVQGRIVWVSGDLFKGRIKTDMHTRQPVVNARGETVLEYGFGLAVPKSELGKPDSVWAMMHQEALTLFPNGQIPPSFAMKYKDGDAIDDKGVAFSQREGYAGHIVIACTTRIPIKYFKYENGANVLIDQGIKNGDYVQAQLQIKAHPAQGQGKAGLYINPSAVRFLGYGKEIINAPSGDAIFGTAAPAIPHGASAVPLAPLAPMPGYPVAAPQPQAPTHWQVPPQTAAAPPQPHFAVLPQQFQPPPGGAPMPAQPVYPTGLPPMPGGYPQQ